MAKGTGYIFDWLKDDGAGIIHVCDGDQLVGEDVAFAFTGCSEALKVILRQKDRIEERDCPPPGASLRVKFDFDIHPAGGDIAVNVRS